ncbi:hypothetical protein GCM10025762_23350 [Haloechinothrix salitolerans]
MCREVIDDAAAADIPLPSPYDARGVTALLGDLERPNELSDAVLGWLIDMPAGGVHGPRGLRMHDAARPPVRTIDLPDTEFAEYEPAE